MSSGPKIITFYQYLRGCKERSDIVGDFARDVLSDPGRHPTGRYKTTRAWVKHLDGHLACPGAYDALDEAWEEYQHMLRSDDGP